MEIHQLRYFMAVAEHGGMRAAARACGVTQPSLSKQIQKLEDELGHRLFDRLPRGAALTAAGQSLRPRAEAIMGDITRALDAVRTDLDAGRGALRVGAIPTLAPFALPGAVTKFRRRFPDADLSITEDITANLVEALAADRLDVAYLSLPLNDPRLRHVVLFEEPLLAVMAANDPLAQHRTITPEDLAGRPPIVLHDAHCLGQRVTAYCAALGVGDAAPWRASQLATVQEWVALGLGISLLPRMAARRDTSRRRVYRPLSEPVPTRAVVAAWPAGRTPPPLATALNAAVTEAAGAGA